jgi:hypothetical protein
MSATMAVAVKTPIPGIVCKRLVGGSWRASLPSWLSTSAIRLSN